MKHYEVFISAKAEDDMEGIYDYIVTTFHDPDAAAGRYDRIAKAILSLEEMPERIKLMDSEPERSKGLRSMIVDNYAVFFVIKAEMVYIVRVLYGASDISKRLAEH